MSGNDRVPSFRRGIKFRFDKAREGWVLLAPEKVFMPDEIAVEILKLVDGTRSIETIVDDLAARYAAPRDTIGGDVVATLEDLSQKGAVQL